MSYRQFSGQTDGGTNRRFPSLNIITVNMAEWDFFAKCLLTLCCCLPIVVSFPNGAPPYETCYYMQPRHLHPHTHRRVHAQGDVAPFNITVDKTTFRPDRPLRGKNRNNIIPILMHQSCGAQILNSWKIEKSKILEWKYV